MHSCVHSAANTVPEECPLWGWGRGQGSYSSASSSREESSTELYGNKDHYSTSPEEEMATHSSTLAWKIPWMEEPGRLQSMGSQRVGHDWVTSLSFFLYFLLEKEMATHSSTLAWKIPWVEGPGGLQSIVLQRIRHDWATNTHTLHQPNCWPYKDNSLSIHILFF